MKTYRRLAQATVLLLAILISGIGAALPAAASAMQASPYTYTSTTTGQTVAWYAPWAYDNQGSSTTAGSEVAIFSSDIAVTMLGFLPTGINMNQARDQVLAEFQNNASNFQTLDRGSYSNVSYSLDMALIADNNGQTSQFGIFTLFLGNTGNGATQVQIFLAPVQVFTQGLNSAKSAITVGGNSVFSGVTPGGLQNLLNRAAGTTNGNVNQQPVNNGNQQPSQPVNNNGNQNGNQQGAQPAANNGNGIQLGGNNDTPANNGGTTQRAGSYTDPTYGYRVQWAAGWTSQEASSGLTLTSDANGAVVLFDGVATNGNSVVGAANRFPSAYVQQDTLVQGARLVGSTSGNGSITFIVAGTIKGTTVAEIVQLIDQPDLQSAVMVRVIVPQSAITTAIPAFQNDVTVNGQQLLTDLNNAVNNPLDAPSG